MSEQPFWESIPAPEPGDDADWSDFEPREDELWEWEDADVTRFTDEERSQGDGD